MSTKPTTGRGHRAKPYLKTFPESHRKMFWKHVKKGKKSECWPWQGIHESTGYGVYRIRVGPRRENKMLHFRVHRLAWALTNGEPLLDHCILHICNEPKCCNPSHMIQGTHQENMLHMKLSGRSLAGTKNPRALLTKKDVLRIKRLRESGQTLKAIAEEYGVHLASVDLITRGKSWDGIGKIDRSKLPTNRKKKTTRKVS